MKQDWGFQDDAVRNILDDFTKEPTSKNLLVIPTGGGKTIAAMKAISALIKSGFLTETKRAIWITHLKQLKAQTEDVLNKKENIKEYKLSNKITKILEIRMKNEAKKIIDKDIKKEYKLLIIDEAHHSAANEYKGFFTKKIGILGLTATPTRNDDSKLEFDKISYSITFRDLIKRNVIIEPKFHSLKTGMNINATSLELSDKNNIELDKFDTEARNQTIAENIFKNKDIYKKVIVFASSKKHVKNIFNVIRKRNKFLNEPYDHVGYILGGDENEENIKNEEYLKRHKKKKSSILINCQVLSEGYDDPSINTVVMTIPTKSLLYYMQCVGRVVRNPKIRDENDVL